MTNAGRLDAVVSILDDAGSQPHHQGVFEAGLTAFPPHLPAVDSPGAPHSWSDVQRAAAWAMGYLVRVREVQGRPRLVVDSMIEFVGQDPYPPQIPDVPHHTVDIWAQLAAAVTTPSVRAQLECLLFEARHGNRRDHARTAAEAYLDAATRWDNRFDSLKDLRLGLRMARSVKAMTLVDRAVAELMALAVVDLDSGAPTPGVILGCIDALQQEPKAPDATPLLRRSLGVTSGAFAEPLVRDEILRRLLRTKLNPGERATLTEAHFQTWLDAADQTEGLLRTVHLTKAIDIARSSQRKDLADVASRALQAMTTQGHGMKVVITDVPISDTTFEDMVALLVETPNWQSSLRRIGQCFPATGDAHQNQAELIRQGPGLRGLFPLQVFDVNLRPRMTITTTDARAAWELTRLEEQFIQFYAPLIAHALDTIVQRHGVPTDSELTAFFAQGPVVTDGLAVALARVLQRFWAADYEGAAFTGAPRVEALARHLAIARNLSVYDAQEGEKPGQYKPMAAILELLHRGRVLNDTWHRMIYTVCCNPYGGPHLRNATAHGLIDNASAPEAAVLIQALLHLAFLDSGQSLAPATAVANPQPTSPTT